MASNSDRLGIYFLDVGQGDCTFVVPPAGQGDPILFDCADPYVAERFVSDHGITNLEAVVASHLDLDHVRGILPFLTNHFALDRRVHQLLIGLDRIPKPGRNTALRDLIQRALDWDKAPPHAGFVLREPVRYRDAPYTLAGGSDWKIQLVLPLYGEKVEELLEDGGDPNRCSAVLRIERAGSVVLVGGDAPLGVWEKLEPSLRSASVIRTPHHGGEIRHHGKAWKEFNDLYDAVSASEAVISVGSNSPYDHPRREHALAAQRGGSCRLLCTQLTRRCCDDPQTLRELALYYAASVEFPYRHRVSPGDPALRRPPESPCAGSVMVTIDARGQVEVAPDRHSNHSKKLLPRIPQRLCQ